MNSTALYLAVLIGVLSLIGVKCACHNYPHLPCIDENNAYQPGETWSNGCQECTCHRHTDTEPRGYHCCDSFSVPVYDETRCQADFDEETCSYKLSAIESPQSTENTSSSEEDEDEEHSWMSSWMLASWFHDIEADCELRTFGVGK